MNHVCRLKRSHLLSDKCWPVGYCGPCADGDHPHAPHEGIVCNQAVACECPCATEADDLWDDCGHLVHEMHVYVQKGRPLVAFCRFGDKPVGVPGGPQNAMPLFGAIARLHEAAQREGLLRSQQPPPIEESAKRGA